jgi:hypothetical protein
LCINALSISARSFPNPLLAGPYSFGQQRSSAVDEIEAMLRGATVIDSPVVEPKTIENEMANESVEGKE